MHGSTASRPRADRQAPDFPTWFLTAIASLVAAGGMWMWRGAGVAETLGDTDDALRLYLMRELASGRAGWWDQHLARLQPPLGMDLHWSRLVDGGLVALDGALRLALSPAAAELATRTAWPFLWIVPVTAAALVIARRLRGPLAALLCAALMLVTLQLYAQWGPGRIDHHDVQISLTLVALAGAVCGGWRGGAVAGLATGLGLAVGVEGLLFEAVIGAAIALRFLWRPIEARGLAAAYGAALTAMLSAMFLIQTPPSRWGVSVCDALGLNLALAAGLAGLGLAALAALAARRGLGVRLAGLAVVGLAAAATYAALEPACLHGPLGQADPRLWPVWLSNIGEMRSVYRGFPDPANSFALSQILFGALGVAAWAWLGRRSGSRTFGWALLGACLAAGLVAEAQAQRMSFYTAWFAAPLVAAAIADLGAQRLRLPWLIILALSVSPTWTSAAAAAAVNARLAPPKPAPKTPSCTAPRAFARLARLPAGIVLSEVDLGPYVLVTTPHSVLAAPYHRMGWGILAADTALASPPGLDEAQVRRLQVRYVVECAAHAASPRRRTMRPDSLQRRLDRGQASAWLEPLSEPGEALQIYRVRPAHHLG